MCGRHATRGSHGHEPGRLPRHAELRARRGEGQGAGRRPAAAVRPRARLEPPRRARRPAERRQELAAKQGNWHQPCGCKRPCWHNSRPNRRAG